MSVHTRSVRRTTLPVLAAVTVLFLAPSAAAADPPALDRNACSQLLTRAASWPGGFTKASGGTYRLVSDAHVSYLLAQPPCASPES